MINNHQYDQQDQHDLQEEDQSTRSTRSRSCNKNNKKKINKKKINNQHPQRRSTINTHSKCSPSKKKIKMPRLQGQGVKSQPQLKEGVYQTSKGTHLQAKSRRSLMAWKQGQGTKKVRRVLVLCRLYSYESTTEFIINHIKKTFQIAEEMRKMSAMDQSKLVPQNWYQHCK